jgi:hypothetical protein
MQFLTCQMLPEQSLVELNDVHSTPNSGSFRPAMLLAYEFFLREPIELTCENL